MASVVKLQPARIRSWLNRVPLFTRVVLFLVTVLYIVSIFFDELPLAGALIPAEITLLKTYRLNTYPFVHTGIIQTTFSLIALIPLLERFEAEHGTLVCLALFIGPFSTLPAAIYIFFDHIVLRSSHAILGASVWVYLLLACEAVKQYRANPTFTLGAYQIPTWTGAIVAILVINFIIPNTSLFAHLCGALIGYGFELGYLKFLVPPEKALRWVESKLNLLGRLPKYVSVDAKIYGRYGVLDTRATAAEPARALITGPAPRIGQD